MKRRDRTPARSARAHLRLVHSAPRSGTPAAGSDERRSPMHATDPTTATVGAGRGRGQPGSVQSSFALAYQLLCWRVARLGRLYSTDAPPLILRQEVRLILDAVDTFSVHPELLASSRGDAAPAVTHLFDLLRGSVPDRPPVGPTPVDDEVADARSTGRTPTMRSHRAGVPVAATPADDAESTSSGP